MTAYVETMINGLFTGIGVICGQYLWTEYIHPRLVKKVEDKIIIRGGGEKENDSMDTENKG